MRSEKSLLWIEYNRLKMREIEANRQPHTLHAAARKRGRQAREARDDEIKRQLEIVAMGRKNAAH